MRITLLAFVMFITTQAFSQLAGRDQNRHGLSFTTGQNKNVFTDSIFTSENWRSHISTGWTYTRYMNFHVGFQTGFWISTTRTAFDINESAAYSFPNSSGVLYAKGLTKKLQINQQALIDDYPYFNSQASRLSNHIESEYSFEIPTLLVFSTNFKGTIRFNSKLGVISKLNVVQKTGTREDQILGGFIYRHYIKPRNKTVFNFNGQASLGFEWNYVGTRSLVFDFSYRTNLTPVYKRGEENQYLLIVSNSEPSWNPDPQIQFLDVKARRHQFALTISTQF